MREINGEELKADFDGHANCFIETGFEKVALINFNYEYEPLPGKFLLSGPGPFPLPGESKARDVFGMIAALKRPDVQEELGILIELSTVMPALKHNSPSQACTARYPDLHELRSRNDLPRS
jgi:hypothetical protein